MTENQFTPPLLKMIDLDAGNVFIGMILAFILCAILSRLIRIATANANSDRNLPQTMIFLGAIVSLIMAVIGNSLARAFGAIGALSLIRFRTSVKSTNDLAYLFMAIAVGMTSGSGYYAIATGATGLFAVFILITKRFFAEPASTRVSLLKISYTFNDDLNKKLVTKLQSAGVAYRILSEESANGGKFAEMLVEVTLPTDFRAADLIREICELSGEIKASILID